MRHLILSSLIATTTLVWAPSSHAGPVTGGGNAANYSCSIADVNNLASDCLGYVTGNDSAADLNTLAGDLSWHGLPLSSLMQFKDNTAGAGSTTALFDAAQSTADASRGQLTFLQTLTGPFVLTLKGGNSWAAYFMPGGAAAGSSLLFDIPGKQGQGLAHASIYTAETPSPTRQGGPAVSVQAVPEPASLALALAALGLLGASRVSRRLVKPA